MTAKKPFLSVYGHVTVDQILSVERYPNINETVDVVSKKTSLGGTGTNIAITAARLGVPTAICAFVGTDFPGKYLEDMEKCGLILDEFVTVGDYETSQCTIVNDGELKQKAIFYQGPQGYAGEIGIDLLKNSSEADYVHFCTGEPCYYLRLMSKLRTKKAKLSLDPSQETYRLWSKELLDKGLGLSDYLFCNDYEAKVIEERPNLGSVFDLPLDLVVRTDGEKGSTARIGGETVEMPCVKGKATVDATGCGDSYRAGFYAGRYYGYSVKDSLILASAVSSFTIEKTGALTNTPTWNMVEERAKPYLE